MTEKGKTLKELKGWTQTISTPSIWSWSAGYTVFVSPDKKRVAQVEMTNEAVSLIFNREERRIEYIHPITARGMKRLGITKEMMERVLGNV